MNQLPTDFIEQTKRVFGTERWADFERGLAEAPPVSIRLNPLKNRNALFRPKGGERVPWCRDGYYLEGRPSFTFDPLLHAGAYYVQEASSMFIDEVLRQHLPSLMPSRPCPSMLDLCAAPGGKSTVARAALPESSWLVSNEPHPRRAQILSENMQKWGAAQTIVTNNRPCDFRKAKAMFDVILTDVPCSGEGMFRKDEEAAREWSLENVERCRCLQREIVADAWECLRPGGLLIYSTCTFNTRENEENIRWMMEEFGAKALPVETDSRWGITGSLLEGFRAPVYRFIPGHTRGEGLFMAVLSKGEGTERKENLLPASPKILFNGPKAPISKSKGLVPDVSEALSTALDRQKYPMAELSYGQAIQYLRKEAITLPPGVPLGFVIVCYQGLPLGFVKNIGNRANNLYPAEWRIKSTHAPGEPPQILC